MLRNQRLAINKKQLICLLLIAGTFGLGSCSSQTGTNQSSANPGVNSADTQKKELKYVKFTLSWLFQGVDAPLTTAIDKGYFATEGLGSDTEVVVRFKSLPALHCSHE